MCTALFVFRCVAPGSALRMSEHRVHCRVSGPVGKALRGGSVYTRQTHNLNGSGAEREPLGPVAPSGPRGYTQTDCSPSPPTPTPSPHPHRAPPLRCRYLVPQGYPVMSGKLGSLSGHCKQAVKLIVSPAFWRKSFFYGLVMIIKTEV